MKSVGVVRAAIGSFTRKAAQAVTVVVDIILDAMDVAKVNYPKPAPELATIKAKNDALKVAINNAASGGREPISIRRAALTEVVDLMRLLALYVTATANGDMAVLLSSGFPIQKPTRTPVGPLSTPETPSVKHGENTGEAAVKTRAIYGAGTYNWRAALVSAPNVYVQTMQTTGSRALIKGLIPGEFYNIQVSAVGAAGPSNWSTPGQLRAI